MTHSHPPALPGAEAALQSLTRYVAEEILDGKDIGLDAATPLLEWGVLNSLEIAKLIAHIKDHFGVSVPAEAVTADNFRDLGALTRLVVGLAA